MKKLTLYILFLLAFTTIAFAAPIDFDNLHVASTTYGIIGGTLRTRLLAAYNNEIYFIVSNDGSTYPSKVYCYNPSDGLSNSTNHSIVAETTGEFVTLRKINNLLYFSDNLGNVYSYDGTTLTPMSGTPFNASDYVSSIEKFNGLMYFATYTGNIFRYNEVAFEQVYDADDSEDRDIRDMVAWQKDGYLYVSVHPFPCCPPNAYVIRSSSGDADSWETVFQGFWAVNLFLTTADYLYAGVVDTAYSHSSTIRRSSDGTTFPIIYGPDGQYKHPYGSLYYDGIAYFFTNDHSYGFGEIIVDDNGSVNCIPNQNWMITQAVELNGEVYALAADSYDALSIAADVYLITTASEPAGPVAYWSFDDPCDPGHDDSGNGNNGTVNGAVSTDGICGKALSFDGQNDYVDVPDAPALNPTEAITITAWFKADSFALGSYSWPHIVDKSGSPDPTGYFMIIPQIYENNPCVGFVVECVGGVPAGSDLGVPVLTPGMWYFSAGVYDGSTVKVYVGTSELSPLVVTSENYSGNMCPSSNNLNIGRDATFPYSANRHFDGLIDEVRIYDRALSACEIAELATECEPEPIETILDFIEESVADETLAPVKAGKPGQGQLGALINMIEAAGNLIEADLPVDACVQLHDAFEKTDGLSPPESAPDFVADEAAAELADMIEDLMTELGC